MPENFESYKNELDRVRLTEGSKKALTESLIRRRPGMSRNMGKRPLKAAHIAAVAAVVCLLAALTVPAIANMTGEPVLGNAFSGDQAGYDQSSGVVGRTAENGEWIVTITDCVGDDFHAFVGVELEAPEGTVLDAEYYEIYVENDYETEGPKGWGGFCYSLPDDDPTDNKIRLIYDWYTRWGESNHLRMNFKLINLTENCGYLWDEHNWDRPMVKEGVWDFGWIDIDYADNAIRLAPMLELPYEDAALVLEEVVISPVGLYLRTNISTPYPIALGDWFDENILSAVRLLDVNGNEIPVDGHFLFGGPGGAYLSFTNGVNAMNTAGTEDPAELKVVDLDRIESVSVAGITIQVR